MKFSRLLLYIFTTSIFISCSTIKIQVKEGHTFKPNKESELLHSFYLIGDAGNSELSKKDSTLVLLEKEITKAKKNSTLISLGDNVYPKGIPNNKDKLYKLAKHRLNVQIDIVKKISMKNFVYSRKS